ncbi:serine arginine repetitive matrix protein 1 [Biomphalaria glabrata]
MANDDAKLKFLPRHLQRSQPAVTHKSKRRVTVEESNAGDEESDRRSVFDRLGPGASTQRNEKARSGFDFQDHSIISHPGKDRKKREENSPDSLKLKFKSGKDRETKVKSQVVVRGKAGGSDEESGEDSDGWSIGALEDKKELELEQKRLEIQRALKALEAGEDLATDTKKSDSSDSESSPERSHKKKKDKSSKKKEKKKHKKNFPDKELSTEKIKEGKRKHDSDDDDEIPHKKRKKKNKDKKHGESPPPSFPSDSVKQKKSSQVKPSKSSQDLYDPASPTSVARVDTPSDKQSLSGSPKPKNKSKKKKKKLKNQEEPSGKSKKVLSPLKKVLKLKRGSASAGSSRRSRSVSHDIPKRASLSRSSSSSSRSSSSRSPVRRKKSVESSRERGTKKISKPVDKKKRGRSPRSSSTSSRTSSTTSSSASRGQKRVRKFSPSPARHPAHKQRSPVVSTIRKDVKGNKRNKRGAHSDIWSKAKERGSEGRQESLEKGSDKMRGRKSNQDNNRHNFSHLGRGADVSRPSLKEGRKNVREPKGRKSDTKDGGRKDARSLGKAGELRKDRLKERDRSDSLLSKDREKRGVSLDREDRSRRGQQNQQVERSTRFGQHGGDDTERRHFEEPVRRFGEGTMIYRFGMERSRSGLERGTGRGNDAPARLLDQGQSRGGRDWEERGGGRREGDEWETIKNRAGAMGASREDGRDFGGGRDDRRGVGVIRELMSISIGENNKSLGSDLRDRSLQRGQGFRDDFSGRESIGSDKRDWKQREDSADVLKQASKDRDRSVKDDVTESRQSKNGAKQPQESVKDKSLDRDKSKSEKKASSKQSAVAKVVKSESPVARDEPSLASLFSQTDMVVSKKKQSTSFGGKKSSKTKEDPKAAEKSKAGTANRGGLRIREKPVAATTTDDGDKSKDASKEDKAGKKEDTSKEKLAGASSPKSSHKNSDQVETKPLRKSKTPEGKRGSTRSPSGSTRSPGKSTHSPAPSVSREKESSEHSKSPAADGKELKKIGDKKNEKSKASKKPKGKKTRSRSNSGSDSESRQSGVVLEENKRRMSSDSESFPAKLEGGDIAAAMLDGIDDGQQEFSDWSENSSGDSILFQVEDLDNNNDFYRPPRHRQSPANINRFEPRESRPEPLLRSNNEIVPEKLMGRVSDRMSDRLSDRLTDRDKVKHSTYSKGPVEASAPSIMPPHTTINFKILDDSQTEKPVKEKKKKHTDDVGYEEISSDEDDLDEEGEKLTKRTIVGILDIDMAALMSTNKAPSSSAPVFQRFKPASLFAEIGLSRQFAGEKLYQEVQETCQRQLEELAALEKASVNDEVQSDSPSIQQTPPSKVKNEFSEGQSASDVHVKQELITADVKTVTPSADESSSQTKPPLTPQKTLSKKTEFAKPVRTPSQPVESKPAFKLYSDTSAYHKLYKTKALDRSRLLANFGMFRRALTARKDLEIRRQLCRIDPKYDQSAVYPSGVLDPDNFRLCLQLFKQKNPTVLAAPMAASACVS